MNTTTEAVSEHLAVTRSTSEAAPHRGYPVDRADHGAPSQSGRLVSLRRAPGPEKIPRSEKYSRGRGMVDRMTTRKRTKRTTRPKLAAVPAVPEPEVPSATEPPSTLSAAAQSWWRVTTSEYSSTRATCACSQKPPGRGIAANRRGRWWTRKARSCSTGSGSRSRTPPSRSSATAAPPISVRCASWN